MISKTASASVVANTLLLLMSNVPLAKAAITTCFNRICESPNPHRLVFMGKVAAPSDEVLTQSGILEIAGNDTDAPMSETVKSHLRMRFNNYFNEIIHNIQGTFTLTKPPYMAGSFYLKSWKTWDREDLMKVDSQVLVLMNDMAKVDDFAHLIQILPVSYNGAVDLFAKDIHAVFRARGLKSAT